MPDAKGESIGEILFDRPKSAELQFESILLGAVGTATLLTLPGGNVGAGLAASGVLLYGVMIYRWSGIYGRFTDENRDLSRTYYLLEGILVVCCFHITQYLVQETSQYAPFVLGEQTATSLAVVGVAFLGIMALEFRQRTYRLW